MSVFNKILPDKPCFQIHKMYLLSQLTYIYATYEVKQTHVIRKLINMFLMTCGLYNIPSQRLNKFILLHHYFFQDPSFSTGCLREYSRVAP